MPANQIDASTLFVKDWDGGSRLLVMGILMQKFLFTMVQDVILRTTNHDSS